MNTVISGRVWLFGDSINTDAMYPAFAMKLDIPEASKHVFYELRPGWTDQVEPGDILIAGKNFGVGSSRPVPAPQVILDILSSGGILARLAEQGYLPMELLDVLRSGVIPQDTGA